ncbi:MAG: type II secretion system protein GspL [Variovorax sp.]
MALLLVIAPVPPAVADGELAWLVTRDDGGRVRTKGQAPLALLPPNNTVVLGVPSAALSWHRLTLPPGSFGNPTRLRAVLDGMLEERLLDTPQTLHFALQPDARAVGPIWVAACDRQWLRSIVQALEASGRRVVRIVPELAPQAAGAPALVFATGTPEAPLFTQCDATGVNTLPLLGAADAAAVEAGWLGAALANAAIVTAEPAVAETAEAWLQRPIKILPTARRWMKAQRSEWDLAQFELAANARARAGKKVASLWQGLRYAPEWRAARWGAALLALVQLVGLNAWAWQEGRTLEGKRQAVKAILVRTFPAVTLVIDAPLQMEREVANLRQATGAIARDDFEPMLAALAPAIPAGRVPSAIDYANGQLRLRGLGLQGPEVAQVRAQLGPRGFQIQSEGDLLLMQPEAVR